MEAEHIKWRKKAVLGGYKGHTIQTFLSDDQCHWLVEIRKGTACWRAQAEFKTEREARDAAQESIDQGGFD